MLQGEELYHFRIDVDYYYCVLSTEMIVNNYIYNNIAINFT